MRRHRRWIGIVCCWAVALVSSCERDQDAAEAGPEEGSQGAASADEAIAATWRQIVTASDASEMREALDLLSSPTLSQLRKLYEFVKTEELGEMKDLSLFEKILVQRVREDESHPKQSFEDYGTAFLPDASETGDAAEVEIQRIDYVESNRAVAVLKGGNLYFLREEEVWKLDLARTHQEAGDWLLKKFEETGKSEELFIAQALGKRPPASYYEKVKEVRQAAESLGKIEGVSVGQVTKMLTIMSPIPPDELKEFGRLLQIFRPTAILIRGNGELPWAGGKPVFKDLSFLAEFGDLGYLKELSISSCKGMQRIEGVNVLVEIQTLTVTNSLLSDDFAKIDLPNLSELRVEGCHGRETLVLGHMPKLKRLRVVDQEMVNLSEFSSLETLEFVPRPADLDELADFQAIKELGLYARSEVSPDLRDLGRFKSMKNLRKLQVVGFAKLSNIEAVRGMPKLAFLDLSGSRTLQDLAPLKDCPQLWEVTLKGCRGLPSGFEQTLQEWNPKLRIEK